jgi:hypothetical protein
MAFDPTKPANNSPNSSLEMRNQLNALKSLNDDLDAALLGQQTRMASQQTQIDAQAAQIAALQDQVTALKLVLTANNLTMSLDWSYSGPVCDGFHIFVHQPNDAPGVFNDSNQVGGDLRSWGTDFDDPADAAGYKFYIVPMDGDGNPLTPPSNAVSFA